MNALPCPNPSCQHVFATSEVAGVSSLHCPVCGTDFQFRPDPSLAEPSRRRSRRSQLKRQSDLPATEADGLAAELLRPPDDFPSPVRNRPRRGGWGRTIIVLVVLFLIAGTGVGAWLAWPWINP